MRKTMYFYWNKVDVFRTVINLPGRAEPSSDRTVPNTVLWCIGEYGIILGWISRRWDVGMWTGSGWPRIGIGGGRL